jgi:hypothetical protein
MKIGIILTGLIENYYIDDLITVYKDCNYDKIVSTWNYTDSSIIDKLKQNNFHVVQSDFPGNIDPSSVNFQNYSFSIGMEKAKELNITHVLRMRSDVYCNNINKLIDIYTKIYEKDKLIFLMYFLNRDIQLRYRYLIDQIYFGDLELLTKYSCCIKHQNDDRYAEKFRQEECFGTSDYNILRDKVIFSAKELVKNNIELVYLKHNVQVKGDVISYWYNECITINNEQTIIDNKLNIENYESDFTYIPKVLVIIVSKEMNKQHIEKMRIFKNNLLADYDIACLSSTDDNDNYEEIFGNIKYKIISQKKEFSKICDFISNLNDINDYDWFIKIRSEIELLEQINYNKLNSLCKNSINARVRIYEGNQIIKYGNSIGGHSHIEQECIKYNELTDNIKWVDNAIYIFTKNVIENGAFLPIEDDKINRIYIDTVNSLDVEKLRATFKNIRDFKKAINNTTYKNY